jgi:hypothetical protein
MAVLKTFPFLVPANVRPYIKLFTELDFHPYAMLSKLPCEVMYDALAVSSARWHGVKGLGTELVRWGQLMASPGHHQTCQQALFEILSPIKSP